MTFSTNNNIRQIEGKIKGQIQKSSVIKFDSQGYQELLKFSLEYHKTLARTAEDTAQKLELGQQMLKELI